jgi:IMP dehydrogenase
MNIGQSLCFDDVLMEPLLSKISTRSSINLETNIATNGRSLIIKTPLISSPMDTVTETDMAIKMALNGGLGIIHRFMDIDEQVSQITKVKRFYF